MDAELEHGALLFQPLDLGFCQLPNRIIMGSMHTGLEEAKAGFKQLAAFYEARAAGGAGLIVTGGVSPNRVGVLSPFACQLRTKKHAMRHREITEAVHQHNSKIVLQILHAGRYSYHPFAVAPSAIQSPISPFKPWRLTQFGIRRTIKHFIRCAHLAKLAGYDGVEIMGSEGYLINQFLSLRTNQRQDSWGGDYTKRMRFALDIVSGIRAKLGPNFIIIFRLSMIDLIPEGSTWQEIVTLAQALEAAGVTLINTGIGWHEARIPTIATMVPRGAFTRLTQNLKPWVNVPLITSNRINSPQQIEQILQQGSADLVSMARPFLADPDFVNKAKQQQSQTINTCIACNQACLDHVFKRQLASCLVNPFASHETDWQLVPTQKPKRLAIIGAGPAGLAFAITAAKRGHHITLFEASSEIGGQFNYAKQIPGKAEFHETLRYFRVHLDKENVCLHLNTPVDPKQLSQADYDEIILATGIRPRQLDIPGINHPKVINYLQVLRDKHPVGNKLVIIGAGGIGFDVATYLLEEPTLSCEAYYERWGIDITVAQRGGISGSPTPPNIKRQISLCQRKSTKMGKGLGKTTGWIHRASLKQHAVNFLTGVSYEKIDDQGLHIMRQNKPEILSADNIIICAGQLSEDSLYQPLIDLGFKVHKIGGAHIARELDAKHAIAEATQLALQI